jgi:hypothetical protein
MFASNRLLLSQQRRSWRLGRTLFPGFEVKKEIPDNKHPSYVFRNQTDAVNVAYGPRICGTGNKSSVAISRGLGCTS